MNREWGRVNHCRWCFDGGTLVLLLYSLRYQWISLRTESAHRNRIWTGYGSDMDRAGYL